MIGFSVFPGIGPVRYKLLHEYFGSAKSAWEAPIQELRETGLGEKRTDSFDRFRKTFDIDAYLAKLQSLHVHCVTIGSPHYPALLSKISDAPFVLYVLGKPSYTETSAGKRDKTPIDMNRTIAIVGTRNVTPYGREVTTQLTADLVDAGCTIVSGLAYGVDAIAHQAALDGHGKTIAVLGCGIDIIAPSSNANLYHAIAEGGGAIVSEMPLGLRPNKGLFPARNRIISGLSLGVVVTEGADDSGALITARYAAEQGRDVFAVPGPITSAYSKGPSLLLKQGAKLVESADDILVELGTDGVHAHTEKMSGRRVQGKTKEEQCILDILAIRQAHIDELVRGANLTMSVVAATLTILEIRGLVKDYGEKIYGLV
jgi:DNA processing protein